MRIAAAVEMREILEQQSVPAKQLEPIAIRQQGLHLAAGRSELARIAARLCSSAFEGGAGRPSAPEAIYYRLASCSSHFARKSPFRLKTSQAYATKGRHSSGPSIWLQIGSVQPGCR
jgi:hypothetical protein